ncbi:MAG: SUMF1/EgtB/PvdO family nonheme iron enzyme [Thermoanaerobaculales bacterium]|nr:SUMF1/EgtB/PvdO family nonheme iron enzyme [Thermoanaerobaculales bacterium]
MKLPAGELLEMLPVPKGIHTVLSNSLPWFEVEIPNELLVSKTEITVGQWFSLMGYNPTREPGNKGYLKAGDTDFPAQVELHEAQRFIGYVNALAGADLYRLPTEAEWEYVASAGAGREFFFEGGDAQLDVFGWYQGNAGSEVHSVGQLATNPWGFHDVYGNVQEWTVDNWRHSRSKQPSYDGANKVVKGGGVYRMASQCGTFAREEGHKAGIRLVREASPLTVPEKNGLPAIVASPRAKAQLITLDYPDFSIPMIRIPGGTFEMGSDVGDGYEFPAHTVRVMPYFLGQHEVTVGLWTKVMGSEDLPGHASSDLDLPVTFVSWDDCQRFINKLNEIEGSQVFRLPTEAEWEFACRQGLRYEYAFGPRRADLLVYDWFTAKLGEGNYSPTLHAPCRLKRTSWGLCDIHGNVKEWCSDEFDFYSGHPTRISREQRNRSIRIAGADSENNLRTTRGGHSNSTSTQCNCLGRWGHNKGSGQQWVGLRLARADTKTDEPRNKDQDALRDGHIRKGQEFIGQQDWRAALNEFNEAVSIDPDSAWAHTGVGLALLEGGKPADSVEPFKKAIVANGSLWQPHAFIGGAYRDLDLDAESIGSLEMAVSLAPGDAWVLTELGISYFEAKRFSDAVGAFEQAQNLKPDNLQYQMNTARAVLRAGRFREAELRIQSVIGKDPDNLDAHYNLALAYWFLGQQDTAEIEITKVAAISPKSADRLREEMKESRAGRRDKLPYPTQSTWSEANLVEALKNLERSLIVEPGHRQRRTLLGAFGEANLTRDVEIAGLEVLELGRRRLETLETFVSDSAFLALGQFRFYFDEGEGGGINDVISNTDGGRVTELMREYGFRLEFDRSAKCLFLKKKIDGRDYYFQLFSTDEFYLGSRQFNQRLREDFDKKNPGTAFPAIRSVQIGQILEATFELWGLGFNSYDPEAYAGVKPGSLVKTVRYKHVEEPGPIIVVGFLTGLPSE